MTEAHHGDGFVERFAYDAALNIAAFSDAGTSPPPGEVLERASLAARAAPQPWTKSPGGRVAEARGPMGERVTCTHDALGRVVERRVERDGFWPMTWRYVWDGRSRLVGCRTPQGERWAYGYDPFGRRLWKRRLGLVDIRPCGGREAAPSHGTAFGWDGDLLSEEAPLAADGTPQWERAVGWHYEPGTFRPLAREDADGQLLYVVTDHLGTPREMLDETGGIAWAADYKLWGGMRRFQASANDNDPKARLAYRSFQTRGNQALASLPDGQQEESDAVSLCPIRFQGQWQDEESGLSYNRFRHYDTLAAQFISSDPIGIFGSLRAGGYVPTSTTQIDPLGLACCPALKDDPYHPDNVEDRIKPPYEANPAHDPSSPLYNPNKGIEPPDAAAVYQNSVRGQQSFTSAPTWYGVGQDGQIYRFFGDGAGTAHFSGFVSPSQVPNGVLQQLGH